MPNLSPEEAALLMLATWRREAEDRVARRMATEQRGDGFTGIERRKEPR